MKDQRTIPASHLPGNAADHEGKAHILKIILIFYCAYIALSFAGSIIIKYSGISPIPLLLIIGYVLFLSLGVFLGTLSPRISVKPILAIPFDTVAYGLLCLCTLTTLYAWFLNIRFYGSLVYIFAHSFVIRESSIGQSEGIFPVYITYLNSFLYSLFALLLIGFHATRKKKYIWLSVYAFILVVLTDLLTFGRIGILYTLFILIAYFVLYRKVRINFKMVFSLLSLFLILNLPRMIRGGFDNFESSVSGFKEFLRFDIPSVFNSVVTVFMYYFSSIYAFSAYYDYQYFERTNGAITFNPIVNIINRFITHDERVSLIADSVYVPFKTNIYSIVKDLYQDFGFMGVVIPPIIFGFIIGYVFKLKGTTGMAMKIYLLAWIFYTPIYNPFSFATFLISFFGLIIIATFFKLKLPPHAR